MASKAESKIDAAAEKAYAEASAKKAAVEKAEPKADIVVEKVIEPVAAPAAPAPVATKAASKKVAPAKKPAAKKAAAPEKVAVKKAAAPKKIAAKKALARKAVTPKTKAAAKAAPKTPAKETIMTKAKTQTADMTAKLKEGLADLQTRAKTLYGKGAELATEMGEFTKGNAEAVVESGKIFAAGVQDIAKSQFEDGKAAVETMTADAKEFAAVKSPTEFVQLQGKIATRNFDATVAQVSKTTEAWVKLANDTFAPLSSRVSLAMEKVRKAA